MPPVPPPDGTGAPPPAAPAADGQDGTGAPPPAADAQDGTDAAPDAALAVPEGPQPSYQVTADSINAVLALLRGWGCEGYGGVKSPIWVCFQVL